MAIEPGTEYPAQTVSGDANYPYGKARNDLVAGDHTGSPLHADWLNDLWGFQQAILQDASVTPSGTPDDANASQYLDALKKILIPQPNRYGIPLVFTRNRQDMFEYADQEPTYIRQKSITVVGGVQVPFSLPFTGMRITSVTLAVQGASGHAGLPSVMPTFSLWVTNKTSDPTSSPVTIADGPDPSASVGAYEAGHLVTLAVSPKHNIDTRELFQLVVTGEANTNALAGFGVYGAHVFIEPIP